MHWLYSAGIVASPAAGVLLLAGLLVAIPLSAVLARRWGGSRRRLMVALTAAAVLVAATQPTSSDAGPARLPETIDVDRAFSWWLRPWPAPLELLTSSEAALNVLLFGAVAFSWVWTGRRASRVLAVHLLWSIGIETLQSIGGQRAADPRDLITNTFGALVGTALGALAIALQAHGRVELTRRARTWLGRRRLAVLAAVLAIAVVVGVVATVRGVRHGADQSLEATLADVQEAYRDVTWSEVDAAMTRGGETKVFDERLAVAHALPDSLVRVDGGEHVEARFPAGNELAPRCVLARWTPDDVTFSTAAGQACTELLG